VTDDTPTTNTVTESSARTRRLGVRSALLALAALALGAPPLAPGAESVCAAKAKPAKLDFTLRDAAGNETNLADYKGRVILLDFWATWCAPCRVTIPTLVDLYERNRERGFVVLGVSVDDPVERLTPFVRELGITYPVLVGAGRYDLQEAFGPLVGFPTSFVIGRDGRICAQHTGIATQGDLERILAALL
jgi:peroxiredoxin